MVNDMKLLPALIACALMIFTGCSKQEKKEQGARNTTIPVTVIEAKQIPWERSLQLVGTLYPNQGARLAAEVEGRVEKTHVEVGDKVTKDQEIAQIDKASYQGQVNLHTANHNKAQINAENQTKNMERLDKLNQTGAVSPTAYDEAQAAQKQAVAEVAATKASLGGATTSLKRSTLKAPFDGVITERLLTEGDFARIGTIMFNIVDDTVLKFRGEIPEREGAKVKAGQKVRVTVEAYPGRQFDGTITWVNPAVNPETRGVGVEAQIKNDGQELKANSFARGEIIVSGDNPAIVVPVEAVINFAGINKVFIVENNVAQPREVKLGAIRNGQQEVMEGLKGGEWVVVGGRTKVQPGSAVKVETK